MFFALWPDEAIRRQCSRIAGQLPSEGLRPVAAKNLHVTLLFLGNVDAAQEAAITSAADALEVSAMTISFDRISYWKKPAVLCLTGRRFDQALAVLAEQLAAIAVQYGVTVDERPFKPHVTLARKARARADVEFEPIVWRADAFCLVESCSGAGGVEYRVVKCWRGESQADERQPTFNPDGETTCLF